MSYKIEIQGNFFVITDTVTSVEEIREPRENVKFQIDGNNYNFFYNVVNPIEASSPTYTRLGKNVREFDSTLFVDQFDNAFASKTELNALLNANLGSVNIASVNVQSSTNLIREVRNTTGATLTIGTVVYINGATGNKPTVAKAQANAESTSARTFGLIQSSIANNANGYVVVFGDLTGVNTSSFSDGAQLYLSPTTAGSYTTTKPVAPNHMVYVGKVTRSHPTLGQIEVDIQNGFEVDELHDVLITDEKDGDAIVYEELSGLWKNKPTLKGLHNIIPAAVGRSFSFATNAGALSGLVMTANRIFLAPLIVNKLVTSASMYINCSTLLASGNSRILIYSDVNGVATTKLYESASLSCATTGIKTETTAFTFQPGVIYWVGVYSNNGHSLSSIPATSMNVIDVSGTVLSNHGFIGATFGSAPTTLGALTFANGAMPFVGITD